MSFPYASYAEYVRALAKSDPGFKYLHTLLSQQTNYGTIIPSACLHVCDLVQGKFVKQDFAFFDSGVLHQGQQAIESRPLDSSSRLVLLTHAIYQGGRGLYEPWRKILDFIGFRYALQPDVLRLHYFDPSQLGSRPAASAQVNQRPFRKPSMLRIEGPRNLMLSAQLCQDGTFQDHTTLFVLASGHWMLDGSPDPHLSGDFSHPDTVHHDTVVYYSDFKWSWFALTKFDAETIESAALHPSDLAIPFAQLFAQRLVEAIESVGQRIMREPDSGSKPETLGEDYHDYLKYLEHLRNACTLLKQFGGDSPSDRFKALLENYQEIFDAYDWKLGGINQLVNYRATTASLKAAEASLEESRRGIEQNDKVKKLTQLAFVFIPLSFVTGAFGMNLNVLNTGSATIWQVVVGTLVVYTLLAMIWGLQALFSG